MSSTVAEADVSVGRIAWCLLLVCAIAACDVTDPNIEPCGDNCPGVSGAPGPGGGDGGPEAGTKDGGAGAAAGQSGAGSGNSGRGGREAGSGGTSGRGGADGAGTGSAGESSAGAGGTAGACGNCPEETPYCEDENCVACRDDEDCDDGVCEDHACVACRDNTQCTSATASRCTPTGCMSCTTHEQCSHIPDKPVCDQGECVACTGTRYEQCGVSNGGKRYVCDSLARTCTQKERGSAGLCMPCVSDAECGEGQLCVMQKYDEPTDAEGEVDVGYFCFWRRDSTEANAPSGSCANVRPYVGTRTDVRSIDGVEDSICGLRVTTCAGYRDYSSKTCESAEADATCGDARFPSDGACETFATTMFRCTTPCLSNDDCKNGVACNLGVTPNVCMLP